MIPRPSHENQQVDIVDTDKDTDTAQNDTHNTHTQHILYFVLVLRASSISRITESDCFQMRIYSSPDLPRPLLEPFLCWVKLTTDTIEKGEGTVIQLDHDWS